MRRAAAAAVSVAIVVAIANAAAWADNGSGSGSSVASGSSVGSGSAAPVVVQLPIDVMAPEVIARVSPSEVRLGDPVTVFVTATYADGVEVNLREPVELGPAFEVRRRVSEDRKRADGKKIREWQLEVVGWEVGDLQLPPIAVTFTVSGRAGQVASGAVPVRVFGVLADPDDPKAMRGLVPPKELTHRDWWWLEVGGVAAVVVIAALVAWRLVRRRRQYTVALTGGRVAPRRFDSPSKLALERLLAIEASGVLARDRDRKRGYAEMVEVVRDYLGARYRVATLDRTTSELIRALANAAPTHERAQLARWLEGCDLVKYANLRTTAADGVAALAAARELILTTTERAIATDGTTIAPRAEAA